MGERVGEIRYTGDVHVRPYRHGTYLGGAHLDELIERALGNRYTFGEGWRGSAVVSIELYEEQADAETDRDVA